MIISRTPFRVSLFGGGSDYPQWYRNHGGAVIGFAIDKYCYITLRHLPPFFEHKHRIVYSQVETVSELGEIAHPCVRAVLSEMGVRSGIELHHDGDLPARSGLGSSSSFAVGLLNAACALQGRMVSAEWLAAEAIRIEQEVIGESVGSQDQVLAAHGGLNRVDFHRDGAIVVNPLTLPPGRAEALLDHLVLVFTGVSRIASRIASAKIAKLDQNGGHIRALMAMVDEAQEILGNPNRSLLDLGPMLHESWLRKRALADSVTNAGIDSIYDAGMRAGAVGGKLLGAGGGGFMLFMVEPERKAVLLEALESLVEVQLGLDRVGSRIVLYSPDGLGAQ
ncbi:D-glycero-alpha-D-manno-heptose-7-phosphate kinase [Tistlia consotensis]|uniref:D-glycero-alpha-D-manno-heptose-7-phosphate kinase n=1 Tax=Tistlia consotensis USBA 355 TaxID=560819 RepID=A0A1Y6CLB9_9PROT|nr:kinase [Tistlia consotensis]SMF71535.1 D-glycero-alpha-D-manno-heptose-7-phosphate kinase [Tistlia consotensis USBA 355]SNS06473.1 D-glycero-alpha-D-manno-heptose-7-phosphate kinase [Tistlia consotensis]